VSLLDVLHDLSKLDELIEVIQLYLWRTRRQCLLQVHFILRLELVVGGSPVVVGIAVVHEVEVDLLRLGLRLLNAFIDVAVWVAAAAVTARLARVRINFFRGTDHLEEAEALE